MDVAVLVLDGAFDSGLAAVVDVLSTANELRPLMPQPPPAWQVRLVGLRRRVRTGSGHLVRAAPLSEVAGADVLVVPALAEKNPEALVDVISGDGLRRVRRLLAEVCARQTPLAAACTSSFILAESGVLDGLRATTSWWLGPAFRQRYPSVLLDDTRMLVCSGVVTTAGAAFAHLDLALELLRRQSPDLADTVARYLILDQRPSQASYAIPTLLAQSDPLVSAYERWLREHLAEPLCIAEAAKSLGVSERTLQRTVRDVLGRSPVQFAQDIRLEQAIHLLRSTDLPLQAITRRVGYENSSTLRVLLQRRRGITPTALRTRYGRV